MRVINSQKNEKRREFSAGKVLVVGSGVLGALAGFSSRADAQVSYSSTNSAAGVTFSSSTNSGSATPTTVVVGDTTTISAGETYTGQYIDGPTNSYTGTGSSQITYSLAPNGITINVPLSATITSLADGNFFDSGKSNVNAGILTNFTVATTGLYILNAGALFGGTATSTDGGALFYTCQLEDFSGPGLLVNNSDQDGSALPDTHDAIVNEPITLIAGDNYTLTYGLTINPGVLAVVGHSSTMTADGSLSLTEVPEPASLSLLAVTAIALGGRRRGKRS